jgi:hypothetical protein
MVDPNEFTDRYVSLWNEPAPELRRELITELWAENGANYTASFEYHGYQELEARVTGAYEKFVGGGDYRFRSLNNAAGHHNAVRFNWEMVGADGGEVATVGLEVFVLDNNGRILADYQFLEK